MKMKELTQDECIELEEDFEEWLKTMRNKNG